MAVDFYIPVICACRHSTAYWLPIFNLVVVSSMVLVFFAAQSTRRHARPRAGQLRCAASLHRRQSGALARTLMRSCGAQAATSPPPVATIY